MSDWELGNDILHSLIDKIDELSSEIRKTHPEERLALLDIRDEKLIPLYRELTKEQALR